MCTVCGRPWSVCLNVCAVCTLRTVVQVHCVQFCDPCACSVLFSVMCSLCVERFYVYSGFACCGYFVCVCACMCCAGAFRVCCAWPSVLCVLCVSYCLSCVSFVLSVVLYILVHGVLCVILFLLYVLLCGWGVMC